MYHCIVPDLRNHGDSFHTSEMSYPSMAEDVVHLLLTHHFTPISLIGHSMGGKVAMHIALSHQPLVEKLVVVDIAPRRYTPHQEKIVHTLRSLPLEQFSTRKEIEEALGAAIPNLSTRRMLLKNLQRNTGGKFHWQINLAAIEKNYPNIVAGIDSRGVFDKPTLFIRGENSDYIEMSDRDGITTLFPKAEIVTIAGTTHIPHAEAPERFLEVVLEFLLS